MLCLTCVNVAELCSKDLLEVFELSEDSSVVVVAKVTVVRRGQRVRSTSMPVDAKPS